MNCLTKLFQQKRRRIGYILAFSGPMISKRDSSVFFYEQVGDVMDLWHPLIFTHICGSFCRELKKKVVCRNFWQTTQYGALEGKTQSFQSASQKVQKLSVIQECLVKKLVKSGCFS